MNLHNRGKVILALSLPLGALIVVTSCVGLFTPGFYVKEMPNWQAQSLGQDMIDLFLVVPVLLITAIFAYRGSKNATLLWGGAVLYLLYTYCIFCFDVHFNKLFLLYCFELGLSFYSVVYFFYSQLGEMPIIVSKPALIKTAGMYFLFISLLFYPLWLSDIIPAIIINTTPKSLLETGLPTNPVHVIDLSVFLPGIFMAGVLVLQKKQIGLLLIAPLLTFFVMMDITIGELIIVMRQRGFIADVSVSVIMGAFALFSLVMLVLFLIDISIAKHNMVSIT